MVSKWGFLSVVLAVFWGGISLGATNQAIDPIVQFEKLNEQIQEEMKQRNTSLEKGEYVQAKQATELVLEGLDLLIAAVMPLNDRIQQLIESEANIEQLTKQSMTQVEREGKTPSQNLDDLIHQQIENREKTEEVADLVQQQYEKTAEVENQPPITPQNSERSNKQNEVLQEVHDLLKTAADIQTSVIKELEESNYQIALSNESDTIDKLEQALEKLKQNSQSNQQQSSNAESQKQSDSQQSQQQQSSDASAQQNQKPVAEEKMMSAEEALKELMKLRKKAHDEKERREEQYGVPQIEGQVPVEKDW